MAWWHKSGSTLIKDKGLLPVDKWQMRNTRNRAYCPLTPNNCMFSHSQHCGYWYPGAKAPGHQYPQCWQDIRFIQRTLRCQWAALKLFFCFKQPSCLRVMETVGCLFEYFTGNWPPGKVTRHYWQYKVSKVTITLGQFEVRNVVDIAHKHINCWLTMNFTSITCPQWRFQIINQYMNWVIYVKNQYSWNIHDQNKTFF